MHRFLLTAIHTALLILVSLGACVTLVPEAFSQDPRHGGFGAIPVEPELIEEQLRLRALERELEILFEQNVTRGEHFEELVVQIKKQHEKMQAVQKTIQQEFETKRKKDAVGVGMQYLRNQQIKEQPPKAKSQNDPLLIQLQIEKSAIADRMKALELELKRAHRELELNKKKFKNSEPGKELPIGVFRLEYVNANDAALSLADLLGSELRFSVISHSNSLLIQAATEKQESIRNLLTMLDQPAEKVKPGEGEVQGNDLPPAVMVRLFWVCQGQPSPGAKRIDGILPDSVWHALKKIGLDDAYLASQGSTSLALKHQNSSQFELADVPATIFEKEQSLNITGEANFKKTGELDIDFHWYRTTKQGNQFHSGNSFRGSVVTPLGHYVILGSTNYEYSQEEVNDHGKVTEKPKTSQFAYVLQVVAAETFEPENNPSNKAASKDKKPLGGRQLENDPPRAGRGWSSPESATRY